MLRGYTKAKRTNLQIKYTEDGKIDSLFVEGNWVGSFEAEEHMKQSGISETPVCYTLIGYASGYYSEICKTQVLFKEVMCKACGHDHCTYVGKILKEWGGEINKELKYYKDRPIVQELEMTYEKLLEERNNLNRTLTIHKRLTEELMNGKDLNSIAKVVYHETQIPFLIVDANFNPLAVSGIKYEEITPKFPDFIHSFREDKFCLETKVFGGDHWKRLTSPILIKKKVYGYCSFVYFHQQKPTKAEQMILERISTICALHILNEKNTFEATEHMKGHFLNQIIDGNFISRNEIIKRGNFVNLNLEIPYHIVGLKFSSIPNKEFLFNENIMAEIMHFLNGKVNCLICHRSYHIILLLQTIPNKSVTSILVKLYNHILKLFPEYKLRMGVSSQSTDIVRASDFYKEALTALQMSNSTEPILCFDQLGIVGLLLQSDNKEHIKQKAKQQLTPLFLQFENQEMLKTLYIFLVNGGNLEKTRDEMSLSLSGLRYRISKLEEILGCELRNPVISYQLLLSLQVLIADGELSID